MHYSEKVETRMKPQPIGRYTPTPSYEELQAEIERLRLTDAEREAMAGAIEAEHGRGAWQWAATLRTLLERTA
jgi:hypothetical protein